MKITCEGCGARYSIGDEVIAGRAVRARCKRCGGAIALGAPDRREHPAPSSVPRGPSPAPSPTGARNESSVLFSPSQLGVLAAPASRPPVGAEGSGLIDIRALAGSLPRAEAARPTSRADDVLGIGAVPIGASLLGAPVPLPPEPRRSGAIVAAVALASGGLVLAACVLAVAITHASAEPIAAVPAIVPPSGPGVDEAGPAEAELESAGAPAEPIAIRTPVSTVSSETRDESPPARDRARARLARQDREQEDREPPAVQPERTSVVAARDARTDRAEPSIDEVVGELVGERRPARERVTEALPPTPPRAEIVRALDAVRPAVTACGAGGGRETAVVAITIEGATGRVGSATVTGALAGTPVGSCVARAVRGATFPRFARPSLTVQFPFRI